MRLINRFPIEYDVTDEVEDAAAEERLEQSSWERMRLQPGCREVRAGECWWVLPEERP